MTPLDDFFLTYLIIFFPRLNELHVNDAYQLWIDGVEFRRGLVIVRKRNGKYFTFEIEATNIKFGLFLLILSNIFMIFVCFICSGFI